MTVGWISVRDAREQLQGEGLLRGQGQRFVFAVESLRRRGFAVQRIALGGRAPVECIRRRDFDRLFEQWRARAVEGIVGSDVDSRGPIMGRKADWWILDDPVGDDR